MTIHLELLKDLNFNQNFKGLLLVGFLKGKAGAGGYDDHDTFILSVWMMTLMIELISLQSASGPGWAKGPTSQLPLSSLQEQGIFRFTPVVNYNLICTLLILVVELKSLVFMRSCNSMYFHFYVSLGPWIIIFSRQWLLAKKCFSCD